MTHRQADQSMDEKRPILIRYRIDTLNEGGLQRPSGCVILWDAAVDGPVPLRIEPPISADLRRIKTPSEFRSLPVGAEVLSLCRNSWWGAIVVQVGSGSDGITL